MPLIEPGVTYPREVNAPFGLPPGWTAIERAYTENSKSYGTTYVRYFGPNGKFKLISSVAKAIELHATDTGLDPAAEVKKFEDAKAKKKEEAENARQELGLVRGEARDAAVAAFRDRFGPMEAFVIPDIEGWGYESKYLPNSGQTMVTYFSPCEKRFGTVTAVEAWFGFKLNRNEGVEEITRLITRAREEFVKKHGTLTPEYNPLRRTSDGSTFQEVVKSGDSEKIKELKTSGEHPHKKKHKSRHHDHGIEPSAGDYAPAEELVLAQGDSAVRSAPRRLADALPRVREALGLRGFRPDAGLVALYSKAEAAAGSSQAELPKGDSHVCALSGVYYEAALQVGGRPCYQWVRLAETGPALVCGSLYIFWNADLARWQIGKLAHCQACYAFCSDDTKSPWEAALSWQVLRDDFGLD